MQPDVFQSMNIMKDACKSRGGNNNTIQRYSSLYTETNYGDSQGSILGLIGFLLYINDLTGYVQNAKLALYADDTNILVVDKDIKVFELETARGMAA